MGCPVWQNHVTLALASLTTASQLGVGVRQSASLLVAPEPHVEQMRGAARTMIEFGSAIEALEPK